MVAYKKNYRKNKTRKTRRNKQRGGNYSLGAGSIGDGAVAGKVDLRVPLDTCGAPHPHPLHNMEGGSRGYGISEPQGPLDQTVVSASGYPIIEPTSSGCFAMQNAGKKKRTYKKKRSYKTRKNRRKTRRNKRKTSHKK
jgi:hypothetical protein